MSLNVILMQLPDKLEDQSFKKLLSKVSLNKQERIEKFHNWKDAYRTLFSDLLVRSIIIKSNLIKNSDIEFCYTIHGKPMLKNGAGFDFNVSHSGEWIACVFDNKSVGVDIEEVTDIDLAISQNYFHPLEHQDIIDSKNATERFFDYWTLKESYIKFNTKGLSHSLKAFRINWNNDSEINIIEGEDVMKNTYLKQYDIAKNYKMAVCSEKNIFPPKCTYSSTKDILDMFNV